jgi:tetratricopeptide (TPR) repeat protein
MSIGAHPGLAKPTPRARAEDLRKAGRFEEAALEYAALWPDGDRWTGWGLTYCLRKLGRLSEALQVARAVYKLDPNFHLGRSEYARTIYDSQVRRAEEPTAEVLKAAAAILELTNSDPRAYAPTCPLVVTVLRVAKLWAKKGRDIRALEWLDKLDPLRLETKPATGRDRTGQQTECASNREQYYSIRSHALERLDRWPECLEVTLRGIADCGRLHHDNDVWFARRVALAKLHLGQAEEAVTELQQLAARKPLGFFHTDIAVAAHAAGNLALVLAHALQALTARDDIGFKLEAARLLAEVLWARGDTEHARTHVQLCLAVRASRGWKPDEQLTSLARSWDVARTGDSPECLVTKLQPLWKAWSDDLTPRRAGSVWRMLPNGRGGFIRADDSSQFFFHARDWKDRKSSPVQGAKVTFATRPGFDPKRQQATIDACEIRSVADAPSPPRLCGPR